jgi:hypothetical protein
VDLVWPGAVYGPAGDTVYVSEYDGRVALCGFNTASLTWACTKAPETVPTYPAFAAAVGDPINNRLILINGVYGDWWSSATGNVWAIDLDAGEWTQILAPSDVFTFAEDDLCEWVSEDEVTSFVRAAYDESGVEWDGTLTAVRQQGSAWDLGGSYCRWEPAGGGWVIARGLTQPTSGAGHSTTPKSTIRSALPAPGLCLGTPISPTT